MSAYLAGVAGRHLGLVPLVRPRPVAPFGAPTATGGGDDGLAPEVPDRAAPTPAVPAVDGTPVVERRPSPGELDASPVAVRRAGRDEVAVGPERRAVAGAPPDRGALAPAHLVERIVVAGAPTVRSSGGAPARDPVDPADLPSAAAPAEGGPAIGALLPRATAFTVRPDAAAPARRPAPAPTAVAAPEPAPTVQVTIGRIEVRAVPAPAPATPRPSGPRGVMSLDEYVAQRRGGAR